MVAGRMAAGELDKFWTIWIRVLLRVDEEEAIPLDGDTLI